MSTSWLKKKKKAVAKKTFFLQKHRTGLDSKTLLVQKGPKRTRSNFNTINKNSINPFPKIKSLKIKNYPESYPSIKTELSLMLDQ